MKVSTTKIGEMDQSDGNPGKRKKSYAQKYLKSSETEPAFKGWYQQHENGSAYCKFCNITLRPKKCALNDYADMPKQCNNSGLVDKNVEGKQSTLTDLQILPKNFKRSLLITANS